MHQTHIMSVVSHHRTCDGVVPTDGHSHKLDSLKSKTRSRKVNLKWLFCITLELAPKYILGYSHAVWELWAYERFYCCVLFSSACFPDVNGFIGNSNF